MKPQLSIVIPAYNESDNINRTLHNILKHVNSSNEILVVVDNDGDTTIQAVENEFSGVNNVKVLVQDFGPGPANAIRYGIVKAQGNCLVVTMADGSDDVRLIDDLCDLVERGCAVAAASRYMPGGAQIGGPRFKKFLSKSAGKSLYLLTGVGTRDATNSYKAYQADFVRSVGITSSSGFEIGIELVAKAHRAGLPIAELPTIWLDRTIGESRFQITKWIPNYFYWYRFAFGKKLQTCEIAKKKNRGNA